MSSHFFTKYLFLTTLFVTIRGNPNDGPKWVEQKGECGGILVGESGMIEYKIGEQYTPGEHCVWMVRANRKRFVKVRLLTNGIIPPCNTGPGCGPASWIFVSEWELNGFVTPKDMIYGGVSSDANLVYVQGPIAYITFTSSASTKIGTGFVLWFQGVGDDAYPDFTFKEYYFEHGAGSARYPEDGSEFSSNELVSYIINPKAAGNTNITLTMDSVQVYLANSTAHCDRDSVTFHSGVSHGVAPRRGWCQTSDPGDTLFVKRPGVFVVTSLNSPGSTGIKKFSFSWNSILN